MILGLDIGTKRIGVSISDELFITAQGLPTIERTTEQDDIAVLVKLIKEKQIDTVVVGLPLHMDGHESIGALHIKTFAHKIEEQSTVKMIFWDERWTTMAAERSLLEGDMSRKKRKKSIDRVAAQLILQGYLDSRHREKR